MRIALINSNTLKPPLSPVGVLYLSAFLRESGLEVDVVDLCLGDDRPTQLARLAQRRPDLVGVSIRNIDTTQMHNHRYLLAETLPLIEEVKRACPGVPIVLGGAGFSISPLAILDLAAADFGVVGEGELPLLALARALEAGESPRDIPGLAFKDDTGSWRLNPPRTAPRELIEALPFQDLEAVDYAAYYRLGAAASLQTKRGCALACSYCTYPLIEGRVFRLLSPARVVDEMQRFVARGFDYFEFTDSVFNLPRAHAIAICDEIIRRRLTARWHTYMSPEGFDGALLERLLGAGNDGIQFGVDTGSQRMLRELGKSFGKQAIVRAAELCHAGGMEFAFNIIFGAPGETLETVQETLDLLDELRPTAVFITHGLRVYDGTPVKARLVAEGKLPPGASLLEPYYYFSEALPADFNDRMRAYEASRDFVFTDLSHRPPTTDERASELFERNLRGPCWRLVKALRRLRDEREAARAP